MNTTDVLTKSIERPIRTNSLRNHKAIIKLTAAEPSHSNNSTLRGTEDQSKTGLSDSTMAATAASKLALRKDTHTTASPLSNQLSADKNNGTKNVNKRQQYSQQHVTVNQVRSSSDNKKFPYIRKQLSTKKTASIVVNDDKADITRIIEKNKPAEQRQQIHKPNEMSRSISVENSAGTDIVAAAAAAASIESTPTISVFRKVKEVEESDLPWRQYTDTISTSIHNTNICRSNVEANTVLNVEDYEKITQDLNTSHAVVTALQFETISFTEAEEVKKKLTRMKPVLGSLYERIRIHIETQRASATLLKLQNSGNDMYKTHNPSSFCSADSEEDDLLQFLKDVQQTSQQASALLDDLFFTSQSVHNMELRYLQHLAGTLALHHQNRINNEEAVAILTHILNKIELLLQEEVHHETEVTIKQQQLTVSSSSMKSTSCASSVSSWSSASNSVLSNDDTVDTAATAVTFGFSGAEGGLSSSPSANSGISVLVQKIEQALEKLRVCYRKQQQEKLMNGNNKRNPPISAAEEELARQRERSAHLVMELERSRSQRNLLMKDEKTIVCLKSQLQQEAKQRQSLIERIASLEALVNTSAAENTEQSKKMKEAAEEQIRKHKQEIEQQRERVAQLELHYQEKQKELTAVTDKYAAEKHTWTLTEQLILKKCNIVFDNDNESSSTDYKEAVTKLVDRYMAERQKVKSLNQQQKAVASKKEAEEKKAATAELEKQALLEEKQKIEHMKRLIEEEKDDIKSQRASLMKEKEFLKQSKQQIEKEKQRLHAERRTFEEEKLKFEMHKKVSVTANVDDNAGVMSKADSVKQLEELREAFRQAQHIYTTRESAFMLQSASTEAELERLLKEYDRLTRNIVDFNTERKKFEDEIEGLHKEKLQLEKQIADQQVLTIKESSLRKEFRELMSTVKDTHTEAVLKELGKQRQLEQELKDVKADAEMKRWDQVNVGVQTSFDFASTMMPFHSSTLLGNERSE